LKWVYSSYTLRVGHPREALEVIDEGLELARSNGLAIAAVIRRPSFGPLLTMLDLNTADAEIKASIGTACRTVLRDEILACAATGKPALAEQDAQTALQLAVDVAHVLLDSGIGCCCHDVRGSGCVRQRARAYRALSRSNPRRRWPLHEYQALLIEAYVARQQGPALVATNACVWPYKSAVSSATAVTVFGARG